MNDQSKEKPWGSHSTVEELEKALARTADPQEESSIRELIRYKRLYSK
ncbi:MULTISPECIES: hypothetical protein [unclassified Roseibium]|nr:MULTISPECIES: hypothetical protein [unclassified Roseibium]